MQQSTVKNRAHYYVVYDGDWKIQCDGENSEPYQRRSEAFKDAVALAHLDRPQRPRGRRDRAVWRCRVPAGMGFHPRLLSAAAGARTLTVRAAQFA